MRFFSAAFFSFNFVDLLCPVVASLIRYVERRHVTIYAGFDLLHAPLNIGTGEVSVPVVHRLELAAINHDAGVSE